MTRTQRITRTARLTATGAVLALGAGVVAMGPAQADQQATAAPAQASHAQQAAPQSGAPLALERSATEPTVYYLKQPATNGVGEVPAPDAKYTVDLTSGTKHEHFVVHSKGGKLDIKDSTILKTAKFDPYISVAWAG